MSTEPQRHPRRRGVRATSPQMTPLETQSVPSLPKAGTFHSPSSTSSRLCDPISPAFRATRSPTSPEDLEEILNSLNGGAGIRRRVTSQLEEIDRILQSSSASPHASILNDRDALPIPSFLLDNTTMDHDAMDLDTKPVVVDHLHASDSGLGSSIAESNSDAKRSTASSRRSAASGVSAVTKSFSAIGLKDGSTGLSSSAIKEIQERILRPLLAEAALKEFHPLVVDIPHGITSKNITTLRDVEKELLLRASDYSTSPARYLSFGERSIQCIQLTVDYLCEREQRRPTDRPYTNNYFLDLVEQIRRYAQLMAASRRKLDNKEKLNEDDYHPGEKLRLRGGLSKNGRPLELVREQEGKVIPIVDGNAVDVAAEAFKTSKRALEVEDLDDDSAMRSMARRKKADMLLDVDYECDACDKTFRRKCDLKKHTKTHDRPFKCPQSDCKYHDFGWPTEKEMQRHWNDKHDTNPTWYRCDQGDCRYQSKRESNLKQHKEKTHNWTYNRTKSNGQKKAGQSAGQTPITPVTPSLDNTLDLGAMSAPATSARATPQYNPSHGQFFGQTPITPPTPSLDMMGMGPFPMGLGDLNGQASYAPLSSYTPSTAFSTTPDFLSPIETFLDNQSPTDFTMPTGHFNGQQMGQFDDGPLYPPGPSASSNHGSLFSPGNVQSATGFANQQPTFDFNQFQIDGNMTEAGMAFLTSPDDIFIDEGYGNAFNDALPMADPGVNHCINFDNYQGFPN